MGDILAVATAGLKPDQLADHDHQRYPRVDYVELQRFINMDVVDYSVYNRGKIGSFIRTAETKIRSDLFLALHAHLKKHPYRLIFPMSERVGIPLAAANRLLPDRKPIVSRITNWSSRQEKMINRLNLVPAMGPMTVMSTSQKQYLMDNLNVPEEQIHVVRYAVDHRFFSPMRDVEQQGSLILTLGEVRTRDYATLLKAVEGLPVDLLMAASGYWYAREKDMSLPAQLPDNVRVAGRFTQYELRSLYAQCRFIVLPLRNYEYAAGVTATLEAMCMERPVIVTRSEGILDYIVDGETGIVVEQGDTEGLREAISRLLADPDETRRLGRNARQRIEEELNMDIYLERTAKILQDVLQA